MPFAETNGVRLFYELTGSGEPIVLVHGSWGDHHVWDGVGRKLADGFRVLAYDRRGHSQSGAPPGQGAVDQDVEDLASLIEWLDIAPAHVAGSSLGSIISLRLASRRPELFRTLIVHEPPALPLIEGDPEMKPLLEVGQRRIASVFEQLESGDIPGGTRRFVEEIMGRPGTTYRRPPGRRSSAMRPRGSMRYARATRKD